MGADAWRRTLAYTVDTVASDQQVTLGSAAIRKLHRDPMIVVFKAVDTFTPLHRNFGHQPVSKTATLCADEWKIC
jgi:hypothetical protein